MRRESQRDAASQHPAWQKPQDTMESSKLIGARVKAADGKDIGEIDSLIVAKDGKVTHVVVGKGGVAGIGETKVVVPWADVKLTSDRDRETPVVTMDPSVLDKAPRYERRASRDASPAASPSTTPSQEKAR
jgi:sporulation protein YlmC with PRC-barrel domain